MENMITYFDKTIHHVKPLSEDKLKEAVEILLEDGFDDILDFCVENGCFTERMRTTLHDGIVVFRDYEENYWDTDKDKLFALYDKVGLTEDIVKEYGEN